MSDNDMPGMIALLMVLIIALAVEHSTNQIEKKIKEMLS